MLIQKHGDPKKSRVEPERNEYYFNCERCGCVFTAGGNECEIRCLYTEGDEIVEILAICHCPNCRRAVEGRKI